MKASVQCPTCGAGIPPDAPEGVCPACALGPGLGVSATQQMKSEEAEFRRAEMATLAAAFPQFELLELIGRGGMGEVYKARQPKLDRLVAIKILPEPFGRSDEYTERFLREARSLARLNHPNIVTIYDFGDSKGLCYIVMEYVEGVDLRRLIEAGTLQPEEALRIVPQICDGLQFAHDAGLVHRDIKPANILLDKHGRVKIADFGLAKILKKEESDPTLTAAGDIMGTAEYMAPEQRRAAQRVDHRADIYSLGVVFYEMLTGEVPMGKFDPPSRRVKVDVRLDEVVLRTLEREPERRYQKASELRTSVEAISDSSAPLRRQPPAEPAEQRRFSPLYFTLCMATALAVWIGCHALWNLRWAGVLLGGALIFAAEYGLLAIGRRWFPVIAGAWRADTYLKHGTRILIALPMCLLGFYFVLGGAQAARERMHWRFGYRDVEEFERRNKGEEYKTVRQLTAYENAVPNVEFTMRTFNWTRGIVFFGAAKPNHGLFPVFGVFFQLFTGFALLANAANAMICTSLWSLRGGPDWRRSRWPILTVGTAFLAAWCVHHFATTLAEMVHIGGGHVYRGEKRKVALPLEEARKRITDALGSENFVLGEGGTWLMNTVPEGRQIGTVAFFNAWKESPFDRWHWQNGWLATAAPQIQVHFIASDSPVETVVRIDSSWPNGKPPPGTPSELIARLLHALGPAQPATP